MRVCLAGTAALKKYPEELRKSQCCLESFYSVADWQMPFFKRCEFFLLDSGAFTFLNSKKGGADFDAYLKRYIEFINKWDVEYFFELDIDPIVGYDKVLEMRRTLEKGTGKRCIPVWHKSRGLDDFVKTTQKYSYIAIGGIVTKEIAKKQWPYMRKLIEIAHANNCKVHGLGFTSTQELAKYPFDSVDSTTWINGGRFGNICEMKNGKIYQRHDSTKRCADSDGLMLHNFGVWCEYQKFARCHL